MGSLPSLIAAHGVYMQRALALAHAHLGQTWPNPSVGAVVVKDGRIVGESATAPGGRPHAETQALSQAGAFAKGATLYVTLEPCSHHGKTPPCADAVIADGIVRCVIACRDPHPGVNGAGVAKLKMAGIEVIEGVCETEARELNHGFFSVVTRGRPYVALKIATSADGKIAYPPPLTSPPQAGGIKGGRQWITSEAARDEVHRLRSQFDAVLTGIGTVLADDPLLTCRLPGLEHRSPVRVVLDRHLRLPSESRLVKTVQNTPLWVITPSSGRKPGSSPLETKGVKIFFTGDHINALLQTLAQKGITRVLVEAGQGVNSAFLESGCVDRLYHFQAPFEIGPQGLSAVTTNLKTYLRNYQLLLTQPYPPDVLRVYDRDD